MHVFASSLEEEGIIARDPSTVKLFADALSAASSDANILIIGDSGTGKDYLASYIHRHSPRSGGPFVHINCSSIPAELFESELFGYAPGTFTGNQAGGRKGLASEASGGTLFLDEIGELDLNLQTKLLQLVQDRTVRSVGSGENREIDFRLICATNQDLEQMTAQGSFRLDLYYRLSVISLKTLPLSSRPLDLEGLISYFSSRYSRKFSRTLQLSEDAVRFLVSRPWSGNVREVQNFMERLYVLEDHETVTEEILAKNYRFAPLLPEPAPPPAPALLPLSQAVFQFEGEYLRKALMEAPSLEAAAQALELELPLLIKKLRKHHISVSGK